MQQLLHATVGLNGFTDDEVALVDGKNEKHSSAEYRSFFQELKERIHKAQYAALKAVKQGVDRPVLGHR